MNQATMIPTKPDRVSSPAATAGAGTFFEQHVNAHWLALLLTRAIPPILCDCSVVEVHFQTERLGWNTDDFLVVGENGSGLRRKLLGQVKRTFNVSATDEDCKKAVQDFWKDFKNGQQFSQTADRIALVTFRGSNTLLEHFSGLLDCARASRDAAEFEARLATSGFLSTKAVHYCDQIRTIVGESEGRTISAAEVWPFLVALHVLSLDLNSATAQTEALIKTLLAHTAREHDAVGAAEASWNALLNTVGEGMPEARGFTRNDLPEAVRQRHSPVGAPEQRALGSLSDHSALILGGIQATIGNDLHLLRSRLVQQVIEKLESAQVVLLTGAAGSGKSGIAKDALSLLAADHFTFSFRAEEFAQPHLDVTLQRTQVPASAAMLGAILAGQDRKIMLVESVERLLEASTRDAFTDLLTLVSGDKSWRMVLTCRDYSADLVRTCFLQSARVGHAVVLVPLLDDGDLQEVEAVHPTLARPLANATLRRLLRNPYVLDKALQISWSDERSLPQSGREFRALFWHEIVRVDHRAAGGMPRRREAAFVQIALRRARALTLYAECRDLDQEVIAGLQRDSLIVSSQESSVSVAPAHDVLEDWAILQWIDEQNAMHPGSAGDLSAVLGTHPALRRTYRKWVGELVERDPATADRLFQAVVRDAGVPVQFRDDTLVSLLRSPFSVAFLERHRAEIYANDNQLLRRVIHLLRVACMTTPPWLETSVAHASIFYVPEGPAWACVLRLVQTDLALFAATDCPLLLGFIEDWARGVSWESPYPEGSASVAAVAHWLMPAIDGYRYEDQRERTLRVIAKIPDADRERFEDLLEGRQEGERRTRAVGDFREMVFEGLDGMSAGRDMPKLVVSAANDYLLCSEADVQERGYRGALELEPLFGIRYGRSHGFFPASAYRGPFLTLLRHHPCDGLAFIIAVFNHSAEWYAHPRVHSAYVEPPDQVTLTFTDGTSRAQWCNSRLWNLYRGTSVGPYALQSLLMSLERWLLELAETLPQNLDAILTHILRESASAALTAVVASAATAFPRSAGETLLVLLRSIWCVLLDRMRLVSESQAPSKLLSLTPLLDPRNNIYQEERKEADALPHRGYDLETAIVNLQLGPFALRVHEILDQHRAAMPPVEEQNEDDRIWRLAIHRMDLRQYTVTEVAEVAPEAPIAAEGADPQPASRRRIRLDLQSAEPDIKEMVDQSAVQVQAMNARIGLLMWGINAFRRKESATYNPVQWRQRLAESRIAAARAGGDHELGEGGPGYVAAVCARDYWDEMGSDEREWCVDRICSEVERTADHWNQTARVQRDHISADRPSATVASLLVGKLLEKGQRIRVLQTLVVALTHAIDEVRWYAAWGVGSYLWTIDRGLALRCANALAMEAKLVERAAEDERSRLRRENDFSQLHGGQWVDRVEATVASGVREHFFEENGIPDDALQTYDPTRWFGAAANERILLILERAPREPAAIEAFRRLGHTLVAWWDADKDAHRNQGDGHPERTHKTESAQADLLHNFVLRTTGADAEMIIRPIVDAVDRHPDEVHWILQGLIIIEDRQPNTQQFWSLWNQFAEKVRHAPWLTRIDEEHASGRAMMSAIFLAKGWKEDVRHWRSLDGYAHYMHELFESLPPSATVLDDFVRFLYHVGEQSLPEAFIQITSRLRAGDPVQMLAKGNTVILLGRLLERYVYSRPLELKENQQLKATVLELLDLLIDRGSSAAFRMRDDFVTPLSVT